MPALGGRAKTTVERSTGDPFGNLPGVRNQRQATAGFRSRQHRVAERRRRQTIVIYTVDHVRPVTVGTALPS
jgi:hypothetical protein